VKLGLILLLGVAVGLMVGTVLGSAVGSGLGALVWLVGAAIAVAPSRKAMRKFLIISFQKEYLRTKKQ